jgi:uncharacterized membrane protein
LEFLFDGIFAIAMTILVLELKIPELVDRQSISELAQVLAHHASTFASYLLTFIMLGIFWYRHNLQYHHFQMITKNMFILHLIQLAAAAFFPFCAALLGRYPTNSLSLVIYIGCVMVYIWSMFTNWVVAKKCKAFNAEFAVADYVLVRNRMFRGCLVISILFVYSLVKIFLN